MSNALNEPNRSRIFASALSVAKPGSRIVDPGCPLIRMGDLTEVMVARGHDRNARVSEVTVNVLTLEARQGSMFR